MTSRSRLAAYSVTLISRLGDSTSLQHTRSMFRFNPVYRLVLSFPGCFPQSSCSSVGRCAPDFPLFFQTLKVMPRLISTQTKMLEDFRCPAWCCCILYEKQNVFSYFLTFFIPAIS